MAEEKNPKRKKLSLQGDKKLSLGIGQDLIKSSRGAPLIGPGQCKSKLGGKEFRGKKMLTKFLI